MKIDILTLFPDFFLSPLNSSILKRAQDNNSVIFNLINIRDFAEDKHKKADDRPFGGGCGMVMKPEPIFKAVESIDKNQDTKIIMLCPTGKKYDQQKAMDLSNDDHLIFICGHYEGIDERVRKHLITEEISIGDYILTGGEIATLTVIDSIVRLIPNVLGNENSAIQDSFSDGLLDCPHYTRPEIFRDMSVPEILLSGNHAKIDEWRLKEKLRLTLTRRPDLLQNIQLDKKTLKYLNQIKKEISSNLI
ncbi:MAG: tRNA (guanosine(37)-N1)-methyltransferase TrmD [Candidatus Sericytochromatia bacterium]|nr:tRNA (guanosine(37)-N1)-methyltransferase TrmD [Candidatus Sericytochromatia bacterium]